VCHPCHLRRATRAGCLLGRTIAAMSSTNGDGVRAHEENLVRELYGQGESIRQIAKRAGFSRPKVDRILRRLGLGPRLFGAADTGLSITVDDDDGDEDDLVALTDAESAEVELTPPFLFVGMDVETFTPGRGEEPRTTLVERFVDSAGHSCSVLDLYRHDVAHDSAVLADAMACVEAAGYVRVTDPADRSRWTWSRA
jgi:hypothetical protein